MQAANMAGVVCKEARLAAEELNTRFTTFHGHLGEQEASSKVLYFLLKTMSDDRSSFEMLAKDHDLEELFAREQTRKDIEKFIEDLDKMLSQVDEFQITCLDACKSYLPTQTKARQMATGSR